MKPKLFGSISMFVALIIIAILAPTHTTAQRADCGNGLIQQLSIGSTGWVIPEPPRAVNVRHTPGGDQLGQILPAENFTVLDGSICNASFSWWQIESDTGVVGWIAEGVDDYFVEPLAVGDAADLQLNNNLSVVVNSDFCDGESQFAVGQSVRIKSDAVQAFYGHPLIENGLFSTEAMNTFYESNFAITQLDFTYSSLSEKTWYVVDGSYCVNGEYLLKLGSPGQAVSTQDGRVYAATSDAAFWFQERDLIEEQAIPFQPSFEQTFFNILPNTSAPLINPDQQVSYGSFGGGGDAPNYWGVPNCSLGEGYTAIGFEEVLAVDSNYFLSTESCMEVYPVPEGDVTVRIIQPNGTLYSEEASKSRSITITQAVDWDTSRSLETLSVKVDIPDNFGLMAGIWQIEVETQGMTTQRAYSILHDDLQRLQGYCDGAYRSYWLNGFSPNQQLDLVYVALSDDAPRILGDGDYPFFELERWKIQVDDAGRLFLEMHMIPEKDGYLVIVEPDKDWQTGLEFVSNSNPGSYATHSLTSCGDNETIQTVEPDRFVFTDLGNDNAYDPDDPVTSVSYKFDGNLNDTVTITSKSYRNAFWGYGEIDLKLELYAPDGILISENDDATSPQFAVTDAEIADFILPETGEYTVVLSAVTLGEDSGTGGFLITLEDSNLANDSNNSLESDQSNTMPRDESDQLIFEGMANDTITVTIETTDPDSTLALQDGMGKILTEDYALPDTGSFTIKITSWDETTGEYTLEIYQQVGATDNPAESAPPTTQPPEDEIENINTAIICGDSLPSRLEVGMRGYINYSFGLNLRETPSPDALDMIMLGFGTEFNVISEPECIDGVIWWRISVDSGNEGWLAESTDFYLLAPTIVEDAPLALEYDDECGNVLVSQLQIGDRGKVAVANRYFFRSLDTQDQLGPLGLETIVHVLGGPKCVGPGNSTRNWYVRVMDGATAGTEGWLAEADSNARIIVPLDN